MSDSKHVQDKWHAEDLRAERKNRLASMKSKDGGKKPLQKRNPMARVVVSIILAIVLVFTGVWVAVRVGVPQRMLTALVVGSERIKPVEMNYYYHMLLSNYGIDPNTTEGQTTLKGASGVEGFPTVADYVKDLAAKQVQQNVILLSNAVKSGLQLSDADKATIDGYLESVRSSAEQAGAELENYLITQFGSGMTLDALRTIFERMQLADNFSKSKLESLTFTAQELEDYYKSKKDTYDVVDYRIFAIKSEAASGATDAVKKEAMAAAKAKANEMLAKIAGPATFRSLCVEYAAEADKAAYQASDKSLNEGKKKSELTSAHATWLFDASRKLGDKTVIEGTDSYTILLFIKRARSEFSHVAVRHILIMAREGQATEAQLAEAKTKAEAVLAEYLAGSKTEAAFGELAKKNSADGNASTGGLYSDVAPGQMVAEFNDWIFSPVRKPGDTDIVKTSFGYHVMYFVGTAGADWEISVKSAMKSEAYTKFLEDEAKAYPYTVNNFGMRFVE